MPEDTKPQPKDSGDESKDKFDELRKKIKKESKVDKVEFARQLATREKLERDYKEDNIHVTFNSSPETKRTVLARRPNQEEFLEILKLMISVAKLEGAMDVVSVEKLHNTCSKLHTMASNLTVDKKLDEEFWKTKISFNTLQNFIGEIVNASQSNVGGISEPEMKTFR